MQNPTRTSWHRHTALDRDWVRLTTIHLLVITLGYVAKILQHLFYIFVSVNLRAE